MAYRPTAGLSRIASAIRGWMREGGAGRGGAVANWNWGASKLAYVCTICDFCFQRFAHGSRGLNLSDSRGDFESDFDSDSDSDSSQAKSSPVWAITAVLRLLAIIAHNKQTNDEPLTDCP